MIRYIKGDLFTAEKGVIVHGCNAMGVMGSGVALGIKTKWPGAFDAYRHAYNYNKTKLGSSSFYKVNQDLKICNMITQATYGREPVRYVSYDALDDGFRWLSRSNELAGIDTISIPMIGAGLGGGDWTIIERIIDLNTQYFNVNIYVLE